MTSEPGPLFVNLYFVLDFQITPNPLEISKNNFSVGSSSVKSIGCQNFKFIAPNAFYLLCLLLTAMFHIVTQERQDLTQPGGCSRWADPVHCHLAAEIMAWNYRQDEIQEDEGCLSYIQRMEVSILPIIYVNIQFIALLVINFILSGIRFTFLKVSKSIKRSII